MGEKRKCYSWSTGITNKLLYSHLVLKPAMDKSWILRTNVYEVNLRQYTLEGTITAFAASLPRLKDMGVETLWFMPITPIAQKNKKGTLGSYYACSDYTSVDAEFGTIEEWKALVRKAQAMGFKVILDWVANHTGWDHHWTIAHPDYYKTDPTTGTFKAASGMDDIIELDYDNPALRRAMIDAMKFWVIETGIDGFRCDLAFWVQLDFWVEAKAQLDTIRPLFWLAELDPLEHPDYMQVFDAAYTWTWMQGAQDFYQKSLPINTLRDILEEYAAVQGLKAWFTTNHDENSWNGTEYEKYGDAAIALAVFSCTYSGIPLIYSGQEAANKKRLQFFEKDVIDWSSSTPLHGFYQTLLTLRKTSPALAANAVVRNVSTSIPTVLAYLREEGKSGVLVLINLSVKSCHFILDDTSLFGVYRNVFSNAQRRIHASQSIALNPCGYLVLERID
ncbi:MAG: 1,4-alpha-glucan branching protein [Flaviaesturariibacter sp.]|nr:1,4-alpha-glucan branching protein [Flaviaesturariibacter sp.]